MAEPKQAKGCKIPGLFYISFRQRNLVAERYLSEDGTWGKMQKPQQQRVAKKSKIIEKSFKILVFVAIARAKGSLHICNFLESIPFQ